MVECRQTTARASHARALQKEAVNMMPQDPMILASYLNMKLRDEYPSLREFCIAHDEDEDALLKKLSAAGFRYDESICQFR